MSNYDEEGNAGIFFDRFNSNLPSEYHKLFLDLAMI